MRNNEQAALRPDKVGTWLTLSLAIVALPQYSATSRSTQADATITSLFLGDHVVGSGVTPRRRGELSEYTVSQGLKCMQVKFFGSEKKKLWRELQSSDLHRPRGKQDGACQVDPVTPHFSYLHELCCSYQSRAI